MDPPARGGENSKMGKKNKKMKGQPPKPIWFAAQPRSWYAAEWLDHLGVKQSELADRADYADSQVSEWVTGTARWNAHVLHRFAKALQIEPYLLLLPPELADDDLMRLVRKLDPAQRQRAMRVLRAADILPNAEKAG